MPDAQDLAPGLMIIHGNRLENLRELVVDWLRANPLKPLENEVMLVQSNGIAQWLQMALAADPEQGGCGIAAAVDVQLPARFLWDAYRSVLGREAVPETSPLDKQPLSWRLMRMLPGLLELPGFAPLQRFLADDHDCRKRYQLAQRLADLFDQYQVYRADWLNDWAAGQDRIGLARQGMRPLEEEERWQPALWRAVLEDVGAERLSDSRAGIHPRFVDRLLTVDQCPAGLPRRVVVFGISSLPAQTLEALAAIGRFSQVLLAVLNPCQYHWGDIVADQDLLRHQYRRQQRRPGVPLMLDETSLHQHAHPLLAAWGKQGRDYINLLDQHDERASYESRFAAINGGRVDLFDVPPGNTLLQQLQQDILELRPLAESRALWPAVTPETDTSLRFHLAHSAQREVEILHDRLLDAFDRDPTLKPRDVIVMVPDVNTYAPNVQAVFGQYAKDDPRHIPFTLTDQGQRGQQPLLIALEHLLGLPDSRLPVSEVLDLLDVPALRARFALSEADLPTLRRWIEGAGIRWGLDQQRRQARGLPAGLEANSWRFGLRRMLLGYASGAGAAWAGVEPYEEVGGLDAALIGPLGQLLERLDHHERSLARPAYPAEWGERLRLLLEDFFLAESEHDQLLLAQLQESLDGWLELCESVQLEEVLPLTVVSEAWLASIGQSSLGQRFLAGAVNICTLMPMRAIPFRHVCLLGMNDGDYPRAQPPLDFDLMGADYRPGDRSRREDDRYLLLEALLSARDELSISWVGRSIRDNTERTPSVLVGQLRDHLAAGWRLADDSDLLAALTVEHRLQPFSRRYFDGGDRLFSYAREWRALHESSPATELDAPLEALASAGPIDLAALQRFLRNPAEHFFAYRLKVFLRELDDSMDDDEPFTLNGLQQYQLREWLLAKVTVTPEQNWSEQLQLEAARLQARGALPLAGFASLSQQQVLEPLDNQLQRYAAQRQQWEESVEQVLLLHGEGSGVQLRDTLSELRASAERGGLARIRLVPSQLLRKDKPRWDKLLADWCVQIAAAASGHRLHSILVAADSTVVMAPPDSEVARQILADWLAAWQQGMQRPLPVAVESAFAYLTAKEGDGEKQARSCYEGSDYHPGEVARSPVLQRTHGDFTSMWETGEFSRWASQLYQPLVDAERSGQVVVSSAMEDQE
ncbi:MAG: exodeoxyribonuclease V subunit gamma [Pseudomonas sp.]